MTAAETLGLVFLVMAALGWTRAFAVTAPAYTMTAKRRRELMRERLDLNPALRDPRVWRMP